MVRRTLRVLAVVAVIAAISAAAAAIVATLRRRRTPAGAASDSPATTAHSSAPAPAPEPTPAPPTPPTWLPAVHGVCPEGYPVKVNESSGIFHLPGGRFYARTIPDRCYTTSDAATADGYRQAKA
jgi:hypothetical protein